MDDHHRDSNWSHTPFHNAHTPPQSDAQAFSTQDAQSPVNDHTMNHPESFNQTIAAHDNLASGQESSASESIRPHDDVEVSLHITLDTDDVHSMPDLQSVTNSSASEMEDSDVIDELEMLQGFAAAFGNQNEGGGEGEEAGDPGLVDLPPVEPIPPLPRGHRRPRVEGDHDGERDRRHPSQRLGAWMFTPMPGLRASEGIGRAGFFGQPDAGTGPGTTNQPQPENANQNPSPDAPQFRAHVVSGVVTLNIDPEGRVVGHAAPPNFRVGPAIPILNPQTNPGDGNARSMTFADFLQAMAAPQHEPPEDPERAKMLVDALEEVPVGLVRRMERVGGAPGAHVNSDSDGGTVGCAICWDSLLDAETPGFNPPSDPGVPQSDAPQTESPAPQTEPPAPPTPQIVSLPCAHVFHASCLIPWFSRPRHTTCPTCRFNIDPENLTYVRRPPPPPAAETAPAAPQQPGPSETQAPTTPEPSQPAPTANAPRPLGTQPQAQRPIVGIPFPFNPTGPFPANVNAPAGMPGPTMFMTSVLAGIRPMNMAPPPPQPPAAQPGQPTQVNASNGPDAPNPANPQNVDDALRLSIQNLLGASVSALIQTLVGTAPPPGDGPGPPPGTLPVPPSGGFPAPLPGGFPVPPPGAFGPFTIPANGAFPAPPPGAFHIPPPGAFPIPQPIPRNPNPGANAAPTDPNRGPDTNLNEGANDDAGPDTNEFIFDVFVPRRERKQWTLPPAPGPSLRQRVEEKERDAGLRCYDVSCGVGPFDDDPEAISTVRQLLIRPEKNIGRVGTSVCNHTFHPECLVSAERVAGWGGDNSKIVEAGDVQVSCPVCRAVGCVSKADWDEGAQALA
jgi:hypothetical protein